MKFLVHELRFATREAVAILAVVLAHCMPCSTFAATPANEEQFFESDEDALGIGFLSGGRQIYLGGCRVVDLSAPSASTTCRYPAGIRWGSVSPDGKLLLATAVKTKTQSATSFQIDTATGRVLSKRSGIYFAPPLAIHPNSRYWVSVEAPKSASASESIATFGRDWTRKRTRIYANSKRIFSLQFDAGGDTLIINAGNAIDGAALSTRTWQVIAQPLAPDALQGFTIESSDRRYAARVDPMRWTLIDLHTGRIVKEINLESSAAEPQAAFSQDGNWFAAKGYRSVGNTKVWGVVLTPIPR